MEAESTELDWRIEGMKRAESQYIECSTANWKDTKAAAKKIISRYFSAKPLEENCERAE